MKQEADYKPIIGLEIHIELKTKSKMFCQCAGLGKVEPLKQKPNTHTCPVCLGLPGALPAPNQTAIEWTMKIGNALNCKINNDFKFDRKHYFYPDLPKGYQISQYDEPIASNGWLEIPITNKQISNSNLQTRRFRIRRVHLEEDTAKLMHTGNASLIDFNRSGVPLVEIVTEPDFDNADDAKRFLEELQLIVRYLDVADADMEKGSMRLEPNISIKLLNSNPQISKAQIDNSRSQILTKEGLPTYKVEVKNINSFSFAKRAIEFEIKRQIKLLAEGITPVQETRGFVEGKGATVSQRIKEEATDYRYFPEPDIPPFHFSDEEIEAIVKDRPALPAERMQALIEKHGVKDADAFILTRDKGLVDYFKKIISDDRITSSEEKGLKAKLASLIVNKKIDVNVSANEFVDRAISRLTTKETDEDELKTATAKVVKENSDVVVAVKEGQEGKLNFLVGQVMKEMKGQADAKMVRANLIEELDVCD